MHVYQGVAPAYGIASCRVSPAYTVMSASPRLTVSGQSMNWLIEFIDVSLLTCPGNLFYREPTWENSPKRPPRPPLYRTCDLVGMIGSFLRIECI